MLIQSSHTAIRRSLSAHYPSIISRRYLSIKPASTNTTPAFAFDIDGVLKQGQRVLPEAREALRILQGHNSKKQHYPFILLTNGGGVTEEARCIKLTKELNVEITPRMLVQSHTVYRSHVKEYRDRPVLVIGGRDDQCRRVAESYGFTQVYTPADILNWNPAIWPFTQLTDHDKTFVKSNVDFSKIQFAAVFVFHDSRDVGRDVQLSVDLLISQKGVFGTTKDPDELELWTKEKQIPFYFSNPDLLFGNDFPLPRFGGESSISCYQKRCRKKSLKGLAFVRNLAGLFQEALASVYRATTGYELHRTVGGKPSRLTYEFASSLLTDLVAKRNQSLGRVCVESLSLSLSP